MPFHRLNNHHIVDELKLDSLEDFFDLHSDRTASPQPQYFYAHVSRIDDENRTY